MPDSTHSLPSLSFNAELDAVNALRRVCAATLQAFQYGVPGNGQHWQNSSNIPVFPPYHPALPLTTPIYYPSYPWLQGPPARWDRHPSRDTGALSSNEDYFRLMYHHFPSSTQSLRVGFQNSRSAHLPSIPSTARNDSSFTSNDDSILADAVTHGNSQGRNLSEVMEELSGVNGHSATDWEGYYLRNNQRIHKSILSDPSHPTNHATSSRPPSSVICGVESPESTTFDCGSSLVTSECKNIGKAKLAKDIVQDASPKPLKRKRGHVSPSSRTHLRSSSKPPRTGLSKCARFTNDDIQYLQKYSAYILKRFPFATNAQMPNMMAERRSHHTARSWQVFICKNPELVNRFQSNTQGDCLREVKKKKIDGSSVEASSLCRDQVVKSEKDLNSTTSCSNNQADHSRNIKLVVDFIANDRNWHSRGSLNAQWKWFSMQHESKRTPREWDEFYRENKTDIDQWVRYIKREKQKEREGKINISETEPRYRIPLGEKIGSSDPKQLMARRAQSISPEL